MKLPPLNSFKPLHYPWSAELRGRDTDDESKTTALVVPNHRIPTQAALSLNITIESELPMVFNGYQAGEIPVRGN